MPAASWDFAKARPKSVSIPMTSPVDFISGPSRVSAPRPQNTEPSAKTRAALAPGGWARAVTGAAGAGAYGKLGGSSETSDAVLSKSRVAVKACF